MTITSFARFGLALCLSCVIAAGVVQPHRANAASGFPLSVGDGEIDDAVAYLLDAQASSGRIGSFNISAWAVMALAAVDESSAVSDLISYLEAEADVDSFEANDWSRMILAIVAGGEDPGDFDGENYIEGLQTTYEEEDTTGEDYMQIGSPDLLNDDFWGMLALAAAGEDIDPDIIDFVLELQNSDGGWGIGVDDDSDVDVTAAGIMALIASGADPSDDAIDKAMDFLADAQNDDGGFPENPGDDSNAASTCWAIQGIVAADEDPTDSGWQPDGDSPVDYLLSLQQSAGYFKWDEGSSSNPEWMTSYAIPALLGIPYPVSALDSSSNDASISRSPTSLAFYATEDGDDPLNQSFYVWNDGDGSMAYTLTDNADWLSVSPSSGSSSGEHDKITVSVDVNGVSAGNHSANITITSGDADNSPRMVSVTLHVAEAADDVEIAFAPEELVFAAEVDGDDPDAQFFELWNAGPDSMEWEVEADEDWLDVSPSSGDSSGEHDKVTVSVDISDLDADDYEATITISSDDATNGSQEITVTLELTGSSSSDEPQIDFSPSRLTFNAVEDEDDPDAQTLQVWNSGHGTLKWVVSADEDWLYVSPKSGTSTGEKDKISVEAAISDLHAGQYTGEITIEDDDDSSNSETVRVTLVIDAPEPEDEVVTPEKYLLVATAVPSGGGTITRSVQPGASGYESGTTVVLTATPSPGYAFVGWSGAAGGSSSNVTVVVNNTLSVTATFLKFDASGLTNVSLAYAPPDLTEIAVIPYPVESIPSSPPGFRLLSAYVVRPAGVSSFALQFDDLVDAENVAVFQVVNAAWAQIPRTVMSDSSLQVTLPASEAVLALAYPGSSTSGILKSVTDFFSSMDSTSILIVAIIGGLVLAIVLVFLLVGRRESY